MGSLGSSEQYCLISIGLAGCKPYGIKAPDGRRRAARIGRYCSNAAYLRSTPQAGHDAESGSQGAFCDTRGCSRR